MSDDPRELRLLETLGNYEHETTKHDCLKDGHLEYEADYGAPGIGQSWKCTICGRNWAKVGGTFHDPADQAHIMGPEDVI